MIDFVDAITHAKDYFAKSNEVILDCKETEDSWILVESKVYEKLDE